MLLDRLVLDDIGAYRGRNEFAFPVTHDKPIVLYGGANGAGKTTLFESIPLCLYGQNHTEDRMTKKQYHQKIHRLFHRYPDRKTSARDASITLEFQYAQNGSIMHYRVTRSWQNNDGKIDEFLSVQKRPAADKQYVSVHGTDDSDSQSMINQMIPRAVANMFFFDGERINDMAQSGDEHLYIKSSFDSLLGLNIADQLRDDIGLYMLRNSADDEKPVLADLEQMTADKDAAEKKLGQMQQRRVFLSGEISRRHRDLEVMEKRFFKLGGVFADDRRRLVDEQAELKRHVEDSESRLRNIISKDLPLAIVPDQLRQVMEELEADEARIRRTYARDAMSAAFDYMINEFTPFLDSHEPDTKGEMIGKLHDIADSKLQSLPDQQRLAFDLSISDMATAKERIGGVLGQQYEHLPADHKTHRQYLDKLNEISARLDAVPQQDEVGPLYSEIKASTIEIGEMEQENQTLERLVAQEKSRIVLLNSKIRACLSRKKSNQRGRRGLEMIPRMQELLEDYSHRLRTERITMLESNILEGVKRCFHKTRLITGVSVDPETYRITLHSKDGEIPRDMLSQGELQLYVMAIVWGLARTSGRPLPFIIDTPLARLDAEHRENVIENFYPEASHQTIMFSTNTEVVGPYYELLKPYVSQAMVILYDPDNDRSVVDGRYFARGGGLIAV